MRTSRGASPICPRCLIIRIRALANNLRPMNERTATFRATFPPILAAIRLAGDGGMRITLDVPESDLAEAIKLLAWRQRVLTVKVEPERGRAGDAGQPKL